MLQRLIRFVHEYAPDAVLVLAAIAIFVAIPQLFGGWFDDNKAQKSIDLALKLLATVIAVAASIASYRRFFRGRVFAPRLRLSLRSHAVRALVDGTVLHAVDVEAENVGGVTVWTPALMLKVLHLDRDEDCTKTGVTSEGIEQPLRSGGLEGIEPGELVVYHYRCCVPADVEAFRIIVELSVDRRDAWHRCITVANTAPTGANH